MDEHPDTKNTTCPGAGAVTPATAPAPKSCAWRSTCPGTRFRVRSADREETAAPPDVYGRDRAVLERETAQARGGRGSLRRGVRNQGFQGHPLTDHRARRRDGRVAEPAPGQVQSRWCLSTLSTSRSATGKSRTGRPMWRSASLPNGERRILGLWAGDGRVRSEVLAPGADRDQEPGC